MGSDIGGRIVLWGRASRKHYLSSNMLKHRKGARTADAAPVKEIKKLVDALSLIRWREEPASVHLLHFTDAQMKEIVRSLRNLLDKLKTWGRAVRDVQAKTKGK